MPSPTRVLLLVATAATLVHAALAGFPPVNVAAAASPVEQFAARSGPSEAFKRRSRFPM